MRERIEKFEEILEKDLKEELDKINNAGTITPEQICTVKDAVKLMLKLQKYKEWMNGGYDSGYSNRRGRSMTTGRYVSRDSYPRHMPIRSYSDGRYNDGYSSHNSMVDELERMYDQAQTEHERYMIKELMNTAEMTR